MLRCPPRSLTGCRRTAPAPRWQVTQHLHSSARSNHKILTSLLAYWLIYLSFKRQVQGQQRAWSSKLHSMNVVWDGIHPICTLCTQQACSAVPCHVAITNLPPCGCAEICLSEQTRNCIHKDNTPCKRVWKSEGGACASLGARVACRYASKDPSRGMRTASVFWPSRSSTSSWRRIAWLCAGSLSAAQRNNCGRVST